jgi:NitT/TauT family transport system permease protein
MTRAYPETTGQQVERPWRFGWTDAIVILAIIVLLWSLIVLGGDMRVRFDELHPPAISLDLALIPYYTARTVLRMFIAFAAALMFTFAYGYIAARSPRARTIMLPTLDILQSVPVLGFLSSGAGSWRCSGACSASGPSSYLPAQGGTCVRLPTAR